MQPEIEIGPITLQTFGLMLVLGFVVCGIAAARFLKELGKPVDWAYEMVFAALVGGIVGARLWWVVENWSEASDDLLGNLFSGAGLVFFGGALGGAIAVLLWAWWRNWLTLQMCDVAAVPLAAGSAPRRSHSQAPPARTIAIEISCGCVKPASTSSLRRMNSIRKRSTPASTSQSANSVPGRQR